MNIGRVLKYLITGVVVGAILFFAGFGVINMLKKEPVAPPVVAQQPTITPDVTTDAAVTTEVVPPAIKVSQGTSDSPIKIKPLGAGEESAATTAGEAEVVDKVVPSVAFGTLTLNAINATSQQPINANFLIQNDAGAAIAQVKATASTTLSFPVGSYKITVNQGEAKIVRYLGVKDGQNGSETFELNAPVLESGSEVAAAPVESEAASATTDATVATGETSVGSTDSSATGQEATTAPADSQVEGVGGLRVSALTKIGNRPMDASFYIQRLNGENIANIKNVTTHQFNLPAGSYRITARTDTANMVKQVEVVASRGTHEIFKIPAETATQSTATATPASPPTQTKPADVKVTGRLELFARDSLSNKPIRSNFYVQTPKGKLITSKTYVESIGYKLPAAEYKVTVRATGYKNKTITLNVRKDQTRREVFKMELLEVPKAAPVTNNLPTATPAAQQASTPSRRRGGLQVNVVSAQGTPLQADITVLRRNGTSVRSAANTSTANFDLAPRNFVVRVRHKGFVTNQQVNIKQGKLAIKTITFDLNTGFR